MFRKTYRIGIAVLLTGIFLYQYAGVFISTQLCLNELKETFLTKHKTEISVLTIPLCEVIDAKLFQLTDASEFRYKGKMYDFVKKETQGNVVRFYCRQDIEEQELQSNFDSQIASLSDAHRTASKTASQNFIKIIIQDFLPENKSLYTVDFLSIKSIWVNQNNFYSSLSQDISSPPPELS